MISRVITLCWTTFCTSTVGASPVTVIVSSSAPTRRSALTVAVNDAVSVDAFALDGAEAGQRERDGVGAGPQVDDLVLARAVGDDGADFLDQRRAGRLDRHAGQHRARRVFHHARDDAIALGERGHGKQQDDYGEYGGGRSLGHDSSNVAVEDYAHHRPARIPILGGVDRRDRDGTRRQPLTLLKRRGASFVIALGSGRRDTSALSDTAQVS